MKFPFWGIKLRKLSVYLLQNSGREIRNRTNRPTTCVAARSVTSCICTELYTKLTWNGRCMNFTKTDQLPVAEAFLRQIVLQRDTKFIALYATCSVITAFKWHQHWSLSRDRPIQSTSHLTSVITISVLSFNSRFAFKELPPLGFQTDILWALLITPEYATCLANLILFVLAKYVDSIGPYPETDLSSPHQILLP